MLLYKIKRKSALNPGCQMHWMRIAMVQYLNKIRSNIQWTSPPTIDLRRDLRRGRAELSTGISSRRYSWSRIRSPWWGWLFRPPRGHWSFWPCLVTGAALLCSSTPSPIGLLYGRGWTWHNSANPAACGRSYLTGGHRGSVISAAVSSIPCSSLTVPLFNVVNMC
jgi:hypothetical protein